MKNEVRKVGKIQSWVELLIYFLIPLLLVIAFNPELLTASGDSSGFQGYATGVNVFTLLGILLFIALMLERFIEVLINTTRKPDQIKYEAEARIQQEELVRLEKQAADVHGYLQELNELNGKIEGMKKRESSMQSRSLSYSPENQPEADDKISKIEGDLATYEQRKRELTVIVEETFRPLLKQDVKKLYGLKEGKSGPPALLKGMPKLRDEEVTLASFEQEYEVDDSNPSITLANILRINREIQEHGRGVIDKIKVDTSRYKVETRIIAIRLAFAAGIIISLIGFRTLEALIDWKEMSKVAGLKPYRAIAFMWTDVMLTGGVIAGGSEGIHKIANVYSNFMDSTSSRLEGTNP